jgi:hypothetical protein
MRRMHKFFVPWIVGAVALVPALAARGQTEPIPHEIESAVDRGLAWLA